MKPTNKKKILVVDDEPLMASSLEEALRKWNFDVTLCHESETAIGRLSKETFDLVLTDIRLPKLSGMEVLKRVKEAAPDTAVIMITAYGTIDQAVAAMKQGAYDYITKPFSLDEIRLCIDKYFKNQELQKENTNLKRALKEKYSLDRFVGQNYQIKQLFDTLQIAFESDASVFIQSENGTGKELIASAIHYNSARKGKPFIKINCASIPENLIESQLFGHEKGAFTGAIRTVKGVFEEAHEGTLLLDEVTEMPPHLQAKLLRVLQEGEFCRVGSNQIIRTDVRIIATSNCDVQKAIEEERFRQDLFFRLDVISVRIPPLRDRKDDIPLLCDHFVRMYAEKYAKPVRGVDESVLEYFYNYHWPGNVRELENVIQRSVLVCRDSDHIQLHHVLSQWPSMTQGQDSQSLSGRDMSIEEMEKRLIASTLKRHNYHKTKTAEILGITLKTLRKKIIEYGLERE
ncbi:MAG: sigma-54-dependent Fis family transcriptional regulator [Calditrichaeota bacterium]|nr:MAG: sigma-54-dependent Fis family transcriptional regulator [Calditrichota bacterium]